MSMTTTQQLIQRNIEDAVYYKRNGWDSASDYCFNQAVLIAGNDRENVRFMEICAFICVLRWMQAETANG